MARNDNDDDLREIAVRTESLPLDGRPYLERFKEMIAELEAHPSIGVTEATIHAPAPTSILEELSARFAVPSAMRRLYEQANGLTVRWEVPDAEGSSSPQCGNINILPIEQVYGSWEGIIWFDEDWDDGSTKPLHPLDFFIDEACSALYIDGSDNPTVYYHYCGEDKEDLRVDFAGYIELLLKSRGFWYWPSAIVSDLTGEEYTTEPSNFRRVMPRLFGDFEAGFFLRRDYEDQDEAASEERAQQIANVREALEANGATFSIVDAEGGYITILVADSAENLKNVSAAMDTLGMSGDFAGDWAAMSIGSYSFEKSTDL